MSKLRITFTGLCAAGPPGPMAGKGGEPVDGPYRVVIPASRPRRAKRSPHYIIPVHLPFIAIRTNDLVNPRDPARRFESCRITNAVGEEFCVWILSREHVTFDTGAKDVWERGKIHFTQTNPVPGEIPKGRRGDLTDEHDVNWLPDMRLIFPEAATLRRECLPPGNDPHVAVQVTVNSGTLSSLFPDNVARSDRPTTFDPPKTDPPVRHVVARQSLFVSELPPNARSLFVRFTAMDTDEELGSIELEVTAAGINMFIGNTDMDDLLRTIRGQITETKYDLDLDFELYYDLLQLPSQSSRLAVPADGSSPRRDAASGREPVSDPPAGEPGGEQPGGGQPGGGQPGGGQPGEEPDLPVPIPPPHHGGHGECPKLRVSLPEGTS